MLFFPFLSQSKFQWQFKPNPLLTFLFVISLPLLVYLGQWQLHRGYTKQALSRALEQRQQQTSLLLNTANQDDLDPIRFRKATAQGRLFPKYAILLDNQSYQKKAGYKLLIPMQLAPDDWILVDYTWLPAHSPRTHIPSFPKISQRLSTVSGFIDNSVTGLQLKKTAPEKLTQAIRVQKVDYTALGAHYGIKLRPYLLQTYGGPKITLKAAKHFSYAIQWYSFAVLLILYYGLMSIKRRTTKVTPKK